MPRRQTPRNPERGLLEMLATDLGLTQDQIDKIRAGLGEGMKAVPRLDPQEIAAHLRAFGEGIPPGKIRCKTAHHCERGKRTPCWLGRAHLARFIEAVRPRAQAGPARQICAEAA